MLDRLTREFRKELARRLKQLHLSPGGRETHKVAGLLRQHDYEGVVRATDGTHHPRLLNLRGIALHYLGDLEEAERCYLESLARQKEPQRRASALSNLASLYHDRDRPGAVSLWRLSFACRPRAMPHLNLMEYYADHRNAEGLRREAHALADFLDGLPDPDEQERERATTRKVLRAKEQLVPFMTASEGALRRARERLLDASARRA